MKWRGANEIPVYGQVLAWSDKHGYSVVYGDNFIDRDGNREFFNGDVYHITTHWTPLPEPPK